MTQLPTTSGSPQMSEIATQEALTFTGSLSREDGQTVLTTIDTDMGRLYEDRNIFLAGGGTVSWDSGTDQLTFSADLNLHLNSLVGGGSPVVINLGSAAKSLTVDGRMYYVTVDRSLGTATGSTDQTTLPNTEVDKESFLIAKRVGDKVVFRDGTTLNNGDAIELGNAAGGSGGGGAPIVTGADYTVDANTAIVSSNMVVTTGTTTTVSTTGRLEVFDVLTVDGTLTSLGTTTVR